MMGLKITSGQTSNWPTTVRRASRHFISPPRPPPRGQTYQFREPFLGPGVAQRGVRLILACPQGTRIQAPTWTTSTPCPGRWWRSSWGAGFSLGVSVPKISPRLDEAEGFLGNAGRKRKQLGEGQDT